MRCSFCLALYRHGRRIGLLSILSLLASASMAQSFPAQTRASETFRVAVPGNLFARLGKDGPEGAFLETMSVLLKGMGKTPQYVIMPVSDALAEVANGTIGAATAFVPSSRISDAIWLSDPVLTESNIVVALKEKGFPLKRSSDLQGKRIGARQGYRYPLLERKAGIHLTRYSTDGEMLRALLFGEVDVILCSAISDIFALRSEGVMKRLVVLDKAVGIVPVVAGFGKNAFSKVDLDAFNAALAQFKRSDAWSEILERNGLADLARPWPLITE